MPADLHRARRDRVALRRLAAHLAAVAVLAAGCSRGHGGEATGDATPEASALEAKAGPPLEPTPPTRVLLALSVEGRRLSEGLAAGCDRDAYLGMRRSAAGLLSWWRKQLPLAASAVYGPEVAIQEAGGSLGVLDRAMQTHDCAGAGPSAAQLAVAFRISADALGRGEVPPAPLGQALSDASYRLGQAILEATPYVPEGDDAALADAAGLAAFLRQGAQALGLSLPEELAPFERLGSARALAEVIGRADLVRATGVLGSALRRQLRERGIPLNLTYRPLRDAPDINALTLPRPALPIDPAQAALGARLFADRRLSSGGARACADCHVPDLAYGDGRATPGTLDPSKPLVRNTPSLLYAPVEALLTWDGRVRTADRQALLVIHTPAEMGSTDAELTAAVSADPAYVSAFRAAFPGSDAGPSDSVTAANIGRALAEFEAREMMPASAPIDRFARGEPDALTADERTGLDVFAGKGRCARCHVPPLFGGSRPPDFTAPVFAVLGVPASSELKSLDVDLGRGDGSFRVPTARNAARTAPYFHHGRYSSLEEVVDFYDRGGGQGLGLRVPNQDPEVRPLHLTAEERRVLLVFLREALTDTPPTKNHGRM